MDAVHLQTMLNIPPPWGWGFAFHIHVLGYCLPIVSLRQNEGGGEQEGLTEEL